MKYMIIVGSHRADAQSLKVGEYIKKYTKETIKGVGIDLLDLNVERLPLWSEAAWDGDSDLSKIVKPYQDRVMSADAFVVISPEWSGMVPAGLKNFFLYMNSEVMGHKPAMIVGVSSTHGGSYPVVELRMSSYKNTRLCYIPDHVVVEKVEDVLNSYGIDEEDKKDSYIKKRINYSIQILSEYAKAFQIIRDSDLINYKDFPFGM